MEACQNQCHGTIVKQRNNVQQTKRQRRHNIKNILNKTFKTNSWKSFKSPGKYLLVKYEDLINDKEKTFYQILNFIHKLKKINLSIQVFFLIILILIDISSSFYLFIWSILIYLRPFVSKSI